MGIPFAAGPAGRRSMTDPPVPEAGNGKFSRYMAITFSAFLLVGAIMGVRPSSRAEDERPLSAAQIALFESGHLDGMQHPATLEYAFRNDGSDPYEDAVALVLREVHEDGSKDVSVEFLRCVSRQELSFRAVGCRPG
jgi:hypothetical protein